MAGREVGATWQRGQEVSTACGPTSVLRVTGRSREQEVCVVCRTPEVIVRVTQVERPRGRECGSMNSAGFSGTAVVARAKGLGRRIQQL